MSKVELTREEFNTLREYVARTEDVLPTVKKIMAQGERQLATPIPAGPAKVQPTEVKVGGIDNSAFACRQRHEAFLRAQAKAEAEKEAEARQKELEAKRERNSTFDPEYAARVSGDAAVGYAAMPVKYFMGQTEEERQAENEKRGENCSGDGERTGGAGTGKPRGPRGYLRKTIMPEEQEKLIMEIFRAWDGLKCCGTNGAMLTPAIWREYAEVVLSLLIKNYEEYKAKEKDSNFEVFMLGDDEGLGPLVMAAIPAAVAQEVRELDHMEKVMKGKDDTTGTLGPLKTLCRRVYGHFITEHPDRSGSDNGFTGARMCNLPLFLKYPTYRQYFRNAKKTTGQEAYWNSLSRSEQLQIEQLCNPNNVAFNYPMIYKNLMRRLDEYEVTYAAGKKEALERKAKTDAEKAAKEARKAARAAKSAEKQHNA